MEEKKEKKVIKRYNKLRDIVDEGYATILKARESWSLFSIMSEFIETTENLTNIRNSVTIFGSARIKPDNPYYKQCEDLSKRLSDIGFSVISGGGPGIMEAANKGAYAGKSASIGLNIDLPHEQVANQWQNIKMNYRHFFARKVAFAKYANAYIIFPGGFGTMDEFCEVVTLIQTNKTRKIPVILVGSEFWSGFLDWIRKTLLPWGMIAEQDLLIMEIIDDTDQIIQAILSFYEIHSLDLSREEREKRMYL